MILKKIVRALGLHHPLRDFERDLHFFLEGRKAVRTWKETGCPTPPPDLIKYGVIRACAKRHRTPVLIETGTWLGHCVFSLRRVFREIHTIELAPELQRSAAERFAHLRHIHCHLGDSATLLPAVASRITRPALFWLDGHFCSGISARGNKDTPISEELEFLLGRTQGQNVVLIDDARLFNGTDGYPTVEDIRQFVLQKRPHAVFELRDDIIRIAPV